MRATTATVRAVNGMTARWAADGLSPDALARGTTFSAVGLWPLLAFLADGACDPARGELQDALGMRADEAAEAARGLLGALARIRGSSAAIGLWARPEVKVHGRWAAGLPDATLGRLSGDDEADKKALDTWAAERTGGLIPAMPLRPDRATRLVLANAQAVRTKWLRPFHESWLTPTAESPWAGRELVGLSRRTSLLDRVGVAKTPAGRLTVLQVLGNTGVDVHLLLGERDSAPGAVLAAGTDILSGTHHVVPGSLLPLGEPGPGLDIRHVRALDRDHVLSVTTSPFALTADHDLLATADLFGLKSAMDADRGHFPGVSDTPWPWSRPISRQRPTSPRRASSRRRSRPSAPSPAALRRRPGTSCAASGSCSTVPSDSSPSTAPRGSYSRRAGSPSRSTGPRSRPTTRTTTTTMSTTTKTDGRGEEPTSQTWRVTGAAPCQVTSS